MDLKRAHYARLAEITRLFVEGRIDPATKVAEIQAENQAYYAATGGKVPKRLQKDPAPAADVDQVVARVTGAPAQQVEAALETARRAGFAAAYADTVDEDRAIRAEGWQVSQEILHGTAAGQAALAATRRDDPDGLAETA